MRRTPPRWLASMSTATLAVILATVVPAAPAWAHNELRTANPPRDAVLTTAPTMVTLDFSEHLNPDFVTIVLTDPARRRVPAGAPTVTGARGAISVAALPGNGTYTVAYRVVSVDGHPVQGTYPFRVTVPGVAEVPAATGAADEATAAGSGTAAPGTTAYVIIVAVVLAAIAGTLLVRRRAGRSAGAPDAPTG